MPSFPEEPALEAFQRAAASVPAYRTLLAEAGIDPATIRTLADFQRLPVLGKTDTFQRFPIEELCRDGRLGRLGSVLTSSGHSGIFSFGLTAAEDAAATAAWIDGLLDQLFQVKSQPTLLINCLPMGVRIPTLACTVAETSVRPDMVIGLVRAFAGHYRQTIMVGDAAFIKLVLESGSCAGLVWPAHRIHVIIGEEPLGENARRYLEILLSGGPADAGRGRVVSSMGVAELGLNLFSEVPPAGRLIPLRRLLHEDPVLRHALLGPKDWVPSLFTYDPRRIFVEFDALGRLLVTTLMPSTLVPLIRYATGDLGRVLEIPAEAFPRLAAGGVNTEGLASFPLVAIEGRGHHALAGAVKVYPEAIKEGLYLDPVLAAQTTANFRLSSGPVQARVRIQLIPGHAPDARLAGQFRATIGHYVRAPLEVTVEPYETFGSGMTLDFERKFSYLEN